MDHIPAFLDIIHKHCNDLSHLQETTVLKVETKPDKTFVTNLDKEINTKLEKDILKYLHQFDTTARVVAEESWKEDKSEGKRDLSEGTVVYIDPIDGTHAFINGGSDWCVMCGMAQNGKPVMGIVWAPRMNMLWFAAEGCGAYQINNAEFTQWHLALEKDSKNAPLPTQNRIHVKEVQQLQDNVVLRSSTRPLKALDDYLTRENIMNQKSLASMGVKCGLIACGDSHLYVNSSCSYWDSCAPRCILEEAGGVMLRTNGEKVVYDGLSASHDYLQVSGTPKLAHEVCKFLQERGL